MGFAEAKKILVFSYFSSSRKQSQIKPETTGECTPSKQAAIKLIKKKKSLCREKWGVGESWPTQESPRSFLKIMVSKRHLSVVIIKNQTHFQVFQHYALFTDFVLSEIKSIEKPMSIKNNLPLT